MHTLTVIQYWKAQVIGHTFSCGCLQEPGDMPRPSKGLFPRPDSLNLL